MHTQTEVRDSLLEDIKNAVNECMLNPDAEDSGMGAIYGMSQRLPDRTLVASFACEFLDGVYQTEWPQENGK